ncbi:MAG: hypothetical protein P8P30_01385 [Rickettsiales bacterium]|nr:hypothetical protein [Rickettsiales bacterium]
MKTQQITFVALLFFLGGCSPQTLHDLIPQHQLTLLQVESYVKPEGGFLLKPDLAIPTAPAPAMKAPVNVWSPPLPTQSNIPKESRAISVSSMLQQTLKYADSQEGSTP